MEATMQPTSQPGSNSKQPHQPNAQSRPTPQQQPARPRKGFATKVLIVEDAQEQLELLARSFRRAGFDVYGAHDGAHAMDRVRDIRPDIIVLDQMMPEVDGITFLQNLRRFPRYKGVPVILVTGLGNDRQLKNRATTLGVKDVLIKGSFEVRDLIDLVRQRTTPEFPSAPETPAI